MACFHLPGVQCDECRTAMRTQQDMTFAGLAVVYEENRMLREQAKYFRDMAKAYQSTADQRAFRLIELERDRDEWRAQHENALACWKNDVTNVGRKLDEVSAAARDLCAVTGEINDDGAFIPCPQASLTGSDRGEIAPWLEAPWRVLRGMVGVEP